MSTALHTASLQHAAHALGGDVSAGQILAPGPGHSPRDRSLSIRIDPTAPDGFLVHSFASDPPLLCRDHVRAALGLGALERNPLHTTTPFRGVGCGGEDTKGEVRWGRKAHWRPLSTRDTQSSRHRRPEGRLRTWGLEKIGGQPHEPEDRDAA